MNKQSKRITSRNTSVNRFNGFDRQKIDYEENEYQTVLLKRQG